MVLEIPGKILGQGDVRETPTSALASAEAVPIGTILPWLKSFASTPALPTGYVECDGSVLSDADSVYDGATLPDLNGDNQFPRGNSTSGGTGGSDTMAHTHTISLDTTFTASGAGDWGHSNATPSTNAASNAENRPPFYDVVWIMRIK
ncbi:MAG: hypothetical protein KJI69_06025 [Patescibacteria group bacterium]|nr:hypothetical protein [Patescibacteria group bacterium]